MKSKIDGVKKEIERIYLHEHTVLQKYFTVLEKLRPYVELGELVYNYDYDNTDELEYVSRRQELKKQIKEQE